MNSEKFHVILFESVNQAMYAEKILKTNGIPYKLIPVPRQLSSNCGVCIRFTIEYKERIIQALSNKVEIHSICSI